MKRKPSTRKEAAKLRPAVPGLTDLAGLLSELEPVYRAIHSHPELSMQEIRTAELAAKHLRESCAAARCRRVRAFRRRGYAEGIGLRLESNCGGIARYTVRDRRWHDTRCVAHRNPDCSSHGYLRSGRFSGSVDYHCREGTKISTHCDRLRWRLYLLFSAAFGYQISLASSYCENG